MPDNVFLDSNVLVYAKIDGDDIDKRDKARETLKSLNGRAFVST